MKITKRIHHTIDLELTEEELAAFDTVSEVIVELYEKLYSQTNEIYNDDSGEVIGMRRIGDALEILGSLAGASSFSFNS